MLSKTEKTLKLASHFNFQPSPNGEWYLLSYTVLAGYNTKTKCIQAIPDYFGDLNVIKAVEDEMRGTEDFDRYIQYLYDGNSTSGAITASADERAEAVGSALGLW